MLQIPESILDYLSSFSFRGESGLRPAGSSIEYTDEMIEEYKKCANDPIYFIEKYVKVVHIDKGVVPMKLYPYQKKMIEAYHQNKRCITMLFRQAGKTTTTAAFITWYIIFNDDKIVAVMANKAATAREIVGKIRLAYTNLPKWLQQGVKVWNKGSIELENGSRVISGATSASAIRGFSISLLYLDELAHLNNKLAEEFFTSVFPTISSGKESKILISSTPNGYNMFHKLWVDAEKTSKGEKGGNGFFHQRFDWWEHPERDQAWADEQRAILGELKYNQEVLMTFLGSSKTLLNNDTLARLAFDNPIKEYDGQEAGLKIYKWPEKNRSYVITVDVSRGRHMDYSAFTIFDISDYPHTIAATYRNNEISPLLYAALINNVGRKYNMAYALIEINDIGGQVADTLWNEYEYEQMFWTKSGEVLGKTGVDPYPGIRTTKKTKRIGCANLKDLIDNNQLIINDFYQIQELSTFVQKDNGSYEADDGFNDDTVATLLLHAWLCSQPWFSELTDHNLRIKLHSQHEKEMEEMLLMPYIIDGTEEYVTEVSPAGYQVNTNWDF